jgi:hypothetical protein
MYRILASQEEVRERRNQLRHPNYQKPGVQREIWSTSKHQVHLAQAQRREILTGRFPSASHVVF